MHVKSDEIPVMLRKRLDRDAYPDWREFRVLVDDLAHSVAKSASESAALQDPPDGIASGIDEVR
jgi:hypothetical protein